MAAWGEGVRCLPSPSRLLLPSQALRCGGRMGRAAFTTWTCCHSHPDISCYLTSALSSPFAASSRRRSSPFKNELCAWAVPPPCSSCAAPRLAPRRWPCPPQARLAQHGRCQLPVLPGGRGAWGEGRIGPSGATSCFSSGRSQRTTEAGTLKPTGCLHSWQRRKLSSHPTFHPELWGD